MRRLFLHSAVALGIASAAVFATTINPAAATLQGDASSRPAPGSAASTDDRNIVHVLNRLAFGPRPGDVAALRQMGVRQYIDRQLHPESLADAAMGPRLEGLTTLGMSARQIGAEFEAPQIEARRQRQLQAAQNGTG